MEKIKCYECEFEGEPKKIPSIGTQYADKWICPKCGFDYVDELVETELNKLFESK